MKDHSKAATCASGCGTSCRGRQQDSPRIESVTPDSFNHQIDRGRSRRVLRLDQLGNRPSAATRGESRSRLRKHTVTLDGAVGRFRL